MILCKSELLTAEPFLQHPASNSDFLQRSICTDGRTVTSVNLIAFLFLEQKVWLIETGTDDIQKVDIA